MIRFSRRLLAIALLGYCAIVLWGTLTPFDFTVDKQMLMMRREPIEWVPFSYVCPSNGYNIKNKIMNLCMLFPFGLLLGLRSDRTKSVCIRVLLATSAGFCFSLSIEIAQYFVPDRTPSASDVLMNTLGAMIGAIVAMMALNWIPGRKRLTGESQRTPGSAEET